MLAGELVAVLTHYVLLRTARGCGQKLAWRPLGLQASVTPREKPVTLNPAPAAGNLRM